MNAILMFGATACSQVNFNPTNPLTDTSAQLGVTQPKGPACDGNLGTTKKPTKMLFIVDMSGSNQELAGCTLGPNCTDAGKVMRAGSITRFFTHYGNRGNFSWAFENFQGKTSTPFITNGGLPVFSDANAMQTAITTFKGISDAGGTPYMAALNVATQTIANDPDLNSATIDPQYIVVFMSDGQPDSGESASTILNQVNTLVNLHPGKISFNAVYYGTNDATAAGLVQSMSQIGHGNFLNTAVNPTGLDFEISDLVNVPCP